MGELSTTTPFDFNKVFLAEDHIQEDYEQYFKHPMLKRNTNDQVIFGVLFFELKEVFFMSRSRTLNCLRML